MTNHNRDWRSFQSRWKRDSRLERFLFWSVGIHLLLVLTIGLPIYLAQAQAKKLTPEQLEVVEKQQEKKKELVEEAEEEIREMLKEELAKEQLQEFYQELTEELPPELAEEYWEELFPELEGELEDLAELLEDLENFEPLKAKERIDELKEQIIDKLAKKVAGNQMEPVRKQMLAEVKKIAKNLAAQLNKDIDERVAKPVASDLARALNLEARNAQGAIQRAEAQLKSAIASVKGVDKNLERQQTQLAKTAQALADAKAKNDRGAIMQHQKVARSQRQGLLNAAKAMERAQASLDTIVNGKNGLAPRMPATAEMIQKAGATQGEEAKKLIRDVADQTTTYKLDEGVKNAKAARDKIAQMLGDLEKAQAALQLRDATLKTDQLTRALQDQEKSLAEAGKETNEQAKAKKMSGEESKLTLAEKNAGALGEKVKELDATLQRLVTGGQINKTKDDPLAKLEQTKSTAQKTEKALGEGKALLQAKKEKDTLAKLKEAQANLLQMRNNLTAMESRLQLKSAATPERLLAQLRELGQNELAKQVQKEFEKSVNKEVLETLQKRIQDAIAKRLKEQPGTTDKLVKEVQKEANGILQKELIGKIKAGEKFAEATGKHLPNPLAKLNAENASLTPLVQDLSAKANASATKILNRVLPQLARSTTARMSVTLGKPKTSFDAQQTALLNRLAQAKNLLAQNRKDLLGRANVAALGAARNRYRDRLQGVRRFGSYGLDVKEYQKMVEHLKDRKQITGQAIERRVVQGETSKAEEQSGIRPALIMLTKPDEKKKDEKPKEREIAKPEFNTHRFSGAPLIPEGSIKIDGDLSDWKDIPRMELDPVKKSASPVPKLNPPPAHQTAYVAYTRSELLIAVDVVDLSGALENHRPVKAFWENDAIEVYLDALNTKSKSRGEAHVHQFFAFPFGHKDDPTTPCYESRMLSGQPWTRVPYKPDQMKRAGKKTAKGWTLELLIPLKEIRKGILQPGRTLGYNLQIDTGTGVYYYWTAAKRVRPSMGPITWGDLQLLGSDAKIELLDEGGEKIATNVVPGQPVRVRVIDPDMNLKDDDREKISVTLRTPTGESETLILEEEKDRPGSFLGSIATELSIGTSNPKVLEVLEGETVTAEYVDQVRAYGERNVPVKTTFTVSSFGARLRK